MSDSITGRAVTHKTLGPGEIISKQTSGGDSYIWVQFQDKPVKFQYPKIFEGDFLKADDPELMNQVAQDILIKQQEREKKSLGIQPNKLVYKPTPSPTKPTFRQVVKSNIAFKCTYCNGGRIPGVSLGFHGVCSDALIRYNIEEKRSPWCSNVKSLCKQYQSGLISRAELERYMEDTGFVCYESAMFRDWTAYAGVYQSGENEGKPIKLKQVQADSLAILTTREPNTPERKRFIFGVFLADESYEGDHYAEGYVTTHSKWKIELPPSEAHKILFWNYYANENSPDTPHWGTGLFRYIPDDQAVQILEDIISVRIQQADKDFAQQFLNHYCTINSIDKSTVSPPNGALLRIS